MRMLTVLILLSATLAGCADEGPPADKDDVFGDFDGDLKATEDTGIIRGVVVDATITPLAGVAIAIAEPAMETASDEQGRFGFSGLPGGLYALQVAKAGFQSVTVQANVVAGQDDPATLRVQLVAEPSTLPSTEPLLFQGHIACSFTVVAVSHATCDTEGIKEYTGNEFIDVVTFSRPADWVQSEMQWKSTQSLGDSMSLSWTDASSGVQQRINATSGPSPLMVSFDRQTFQEMNLTGKELWLRVFSTQRDGTDVIPEQTAHDAWASSGYGVYNGTGQKGTVDDAMDQNVFGLGTQSPLQEDCVRHAVLFASCIGLGGVGATVEQSYSVFTTQFFNFRPDAGWMFVVDGEHPIPQT